MDLMSDSSKKHRAAFGATTSVTTWHRHAANICTDWTIDAGRRCQSLTACRGTGEGGGKQCIPVSSVVSDQWRRNELKVGGTRLAQNAGKKFVVSIHFWALCFGERFHDCQYSLVFLFAVLLLTVLPCAQPFVKTGHVPPCPMESEPLFLIHIIGDFGHSSFYFFLAVVSTRPRVTSFIFVVWIFITRYRPNSLSRTYAVTV